MIVKNWVLRDQYPSGTGHGEFVRYEGRTPGGSPVWATVSRYSVYVALMDAEKILTWPPKLHVVLSKDDRDVYRIPTPEELDELLEDVEWGAKNKV